MRSARTNSALEDGKSDIPCPTAVAAADLKVSHFEKAGHGNSFGVWRASAPRQAFSVPISELPFAANDGEARPAGLGFAEAKCEMENPIPADEYRCPSRLLFSDHARAWLRKAREERRGNPERCLFAAALSVSFADALTKVEEPSEEAVNLQAEAWAELANARRLTGDHEAAERGFLAAIRRVSRPALLRHISEDVAALLVAKREFALAEELLSEVEAAYRLLGDDHSAGRVRLRRGLAAAYGQDDSVALEHLLASLRLLNLENDPALTLAAFHNTIDCAARLGHFEMARVWLDRCKPLYQEWGNRTDLLRREWLEAKINARLGNLPRAEAYLRGARAEFENLGLFYEACLITIDLCAVWIRRCKFDEVTFGVGEAIWIFRALKVRREALASLLLLQEAARAEQATMAMVQAAESALRDTPRLRTILTPEVAS